MNVIFLLLNVSQERHYHWQLPIRSCCGSMLRVASQPEASTLFTKVTFSSSSFLKNTLNNSRQIENEGLFLWIVKVLLHFLLLIVVMLVLQLCHAPATASAAQYQSLAMAGGSVLSSRLVLWSGSNAVQVTC